MQRVICVINLITHTKIQQRREEGHYTCWHTGNEETNLGKKQDLTPISALRDYEEARVVRGKKLDFPDAFIHQKAKYVAKLKGKKLTAFYSFDKAVEQLSSAKIL